MIRYPVTKKDYSTSYKCMMNALLVCSTVKNTHSLPFLEASQDARQTKMFLSFHTLRIYCASGFLLCARRYNLINKACDYITRRLSQTVQEAPAIWCYFSSQHDSALKKQLLRQRNCFGRCKGARYHIR